MKKLFLLLTTAVSLYGHNPLGEMANYKVDRDPKRTSSMVQSGTVNASVPKYIENAEGGPSYQVALEYHFNFGFLGKYDGVEETLIESEFFTEEFLENLRKNGSYAGSNFNAKHLGFADAKNLDGKFYPHCDKVLLTDMKKPQTFIFLQDFLSHMVTGHRDSIEDMKALAHIYPGVPVLGAVKLDVSGIYKGLAVKAGADYNAASR